ncbi:DUF547 domain-containing protein [Kordiimonas lacus]|uniref:DUF547 domain-containing protein n=1 Tax=Kordiimonas lacus TaxID=637679 RepID=A0A1G7B287_9PROT|nr:DUF547 domain-containing protein [Kordiimonas lacus]SDE21209.1 Protein of unknown function, DUF547 [Kordiimonas lacus]
MTFKQITHALKLGAAALASVVSVSVAWAGESGVPAPFRGDSPDSDFSIKYEDWDAMLGQTVLDTGMSDRTEASKVRPRAGSRIIRGGGGTTRLEGNRVDFHAFLGDNLLVLRKLRDDLAKVPELAPLNMFNRDEQLAYWLNLYNVTLVTQIAEIFPETNLKKFYPEIWDDKVLTVSGVPLSLNDIHHKILVPKYRDPRIMYGLFQGVVGGPNLRDEAFEGFRVWRQLEANANEFVNSNRGAFVRERILRTSYFYEVNSALFPDFDRDLRRHILKYARPTFADKIQDGSTVVGTGQSNWYIADMFGGNRAKGSANTNAGALLLAFRTGGGVGSEGSSVQMANGPGDPSGAGDSGGYAGGTKQTSWTNSIEQKMISVRFPSHMMEYLRDIQMRKMRRVREGKVELEEYDPPADDETAEPADN